MIYDAYKEKILKLAKKVEFVRKYIWLFASALALIVGLMAAFVIFHGRITSSLQLSTASFVYGEGFTYDARAVLCRVDYEFREKGGGTWSKEEPVLPGTYEIRAVSDSFLKAPQYSETLTFVITPRPLTVTAADSLLYGETPKLVTTGTVSSDTVEGVTFRIDGLGKRETVTVIPVTSGIVIRNRAGENVTSAYEITAQSKEVLLQKREITLTIAGKTQVYDGNPLSSSAYEVTKGSLPEGDVLSLAFPKQLTVPGEIENTPESISIRNASGADMTSCYNITLSVGKLSLLPRPLTIAFDSIQLVYDGKAHAASGCTVKDGSLLAGHRLSLGNAPSFTDAGSYKNSFFVTVLGKNGEDVSGYYKLTREDGTVMISPRPIEIATESASKTYDGTSLLCHRYVTGGDGLVGGHVLSLAFTGEQRFAGESKNTVSDVFVADSAGKDVTKNYRISYKTGSLKVQKRQLSFVTASGEKVYDGVPLTCEKYRITSGTLASFDTLILEYTGSQTTAGSSKNTFRKVTVLTADGEDATSSYELMSTEGILTVKRRPMSFVTGSSEKNYDGRPLVCHEYMTTSGSLVEGEELSIGYTGSQTAVGSSDNTLRAFQVISATGDDVTSSYQITYQLGTLTVKKSLSPSPTPDPELPNPELPNPEIPDPELPDPELPNPELPDPNPEPNPDAPEILGEIYIEPEIMIVEYDGKGHRVESFSWSCDKLPAGYSVTVSFLPKTDAGMYRAEIEQFRVYDAAGNDVTSSFEYRVSPDVTLFILKRQITVRTGSAVKKYDGTALTSSEAWISIGSLGDGHRITVPLSAARTEVGERENDCRLEDVRITDARGTPVTSNYEVTIFFGTLTVLP